LRPHNYQSDYTAAKAKSQKSGIKNPFNNSFILTSGKWIISARIKGMTTENPSHAQINPFENAILFDGANKVF
jgi:hypothetical protein